jgi:creatinine amidohydrolase
MFEETPYERLTPATLEARIKATPVAYLPLGTLEWHGPHLPLGSDHLQSQGFFTQLARRAWGVVLPPLFLGPASAKTVDGIEYYGMDVHQKAYPHPIRLSGSAYWVPDKLFIDILDAALKQLRRTGFRVVVAHGHGPSTDLVLKNREALEKRYDLKMLTLWEDEDRDRDTGFQTDHAAANETSIMMALHPTLLHMEHLLRDPAEKPLATIGKDPRAHASPVRGQRIIAAHLSEWSSCRGRNWPGSLRLPGRGRGRRIKDDSCPSSNRSACYFAGPPRFTSPP